MRITLAAHVQAGWSNTAVTLPDGQSYLMSQQSAGRCQLARMGRVWSCTAPQNQLEEQPAEGKLHKQFSSMQEAAVHRKDIVCFPHPFGDKTKS